jgi:superfamily II DNA or RNA helicase
VTLFEPDPALHLKPLRGRQIPAILSILQAIKEGHKHFVVQAPTGYGKTILAAHIVDRCLKKGNRALFIAPAINLVNQTLKSFEAQGIRDIGVMQQRHERTSIYAHLQIACLPTLVRRKTPDVQLVLVDECHLQSAALYRLMDTIWKDVIVIGLTATPWARGMGLHYTKLVVLATMKEMIEDGPPAGLCEWWGFGVPPEFVPDMSGVDRVAGVLNESGVSHVMSARRIVGNTVETWLKHRQLENHPGDRTFLYGVDCAHARVLMEAFNAQGIKFGYMDGNSEPEERRRVFRDFDSRESKGICNVGVLITGVDKDVRVIDDNCYTESEIRLVQEHGRGERLKADGARLFVLDHAGNRDRLGKPEDIHHDHLDTRKPGEKGEAYEGDKPTPKPRKCRKCFYLIPPKTKVCPNCGDVYVAPNTIEHVAGELVELGARQMKLPKAKMDEKQAFYSGLLMIAQQRGFKDGWVSHKYQEKFGVWPKGLERIPRTPRKAVVEFERESRKRYLAEKKQHETEEQA